MIANTIFNALNTIKGCKIVAIEYSGEVKLLKRGNPLASANVTKITKITAQFGYSYENAVNNRLQRAGAENDFTADSLPWGTWLVPNKFIEYKGSVYVRFYSMKNGQASVQYFVNGQPASEAEIAIIKQFTPVRKESAKQSEAGLTENQVRPFNVNLENILKVTCKGGE